MNNGKKYYETLVLNEQKGEVCSVKLQGDPVIYTAIPMIQARYQNQSPQKFMMNVLAPEKYKGIYEKLLSEIETLE